MKISKIEAIPLASEFKEGTAYGISKGLINKRTMTLICITTDEGITGYGEAWGPPLVIREYIKQFSDFYLRQDPFDSGAIWNRVVNTLYHYGTQGLHFAALGGIDIAIWDIKGKALTLPISKLLGGNTRTEVMAYASGGYFTNHGSTLDEQVEQAVQKGFKAYKIKIGRDLRSDIQRVERTRELIGSESLLMADVNSNYTVDQAVLTAKHIEPFNVHWLEEPLPPYDFQGLRQLASKTNIPISLGEALYTAHSYKPLFDDRSIHIIQPDVCKCGGFEEIRKIIAAAQLVNIRVSPHVWGGAVGFAANLQLLAHLPATPHTDHEPNPLLLEFDQALNPLRSDLLTEPFTLENGKVKIPDEPGLGIVLDEEKIRYYKIDQRVIV